jgi:hypothetical protein
MVWLTLLATAGALSCPVERAQYVLRTAPQYTTSFVAVDSGHDWPSGVALKLHSNVTKKNYWFVPWNGGTDALTLPRWPSTSAVNRAVVRSCQRYHLATTPTSQIARSLAS